MQFNSGGHHSKIINIGSDTWIEPLARFVSTSITHQTWLPFQVMTCAIVLFEGTQAARKDLVASGVEFLYYGTAHAARSRCKKKVIVCTAFVE
jgi:hypothetical protein